MAADVLQVIPSFYAMFKKNSPFTSANTYENFIVSKEYCIAHHAADICFLPNCRCHISLLGNFEEILRKLDSIGFTYEHVDCLYTSFNNQFTRIIVAKNSQMFDKVQRAVCFNQRSRGVERMPRFCWLVLINILAI